MMLLGAELRRFHARRMLLVAALVGLAAVGLTLYGTYTVIRPLSPDQRAAAEAAFASAQADWEENGDEQIASCLDQQALDREQSGDQTLDYGCDAMAPQEEWFVPNAPPLTAQISGVLTVLTFALGFLALLAGATFTAAEASTRSLSTWLTFEPRRGRVFATKLGAAGLGVVLPTLALLGVVVGGSIGIFALVGASTSLTVEAGISPVPDVLGRLVALTVGVAVAAAALGLLLRHTLGVLGLAFGWAIAVEGILGGMVPRLSPWLVLPNVNAWVNGTAQYYVPHCTVSAQGTTCDYVTRTVSMTHGGIYLAALVTLLVVASALVFRRRDLT